MRKTGKRITREEYEAKYGRPSQQDNDAVNKAGIERDYNIAYNIGINQLGLDHPGAVHYAQETVFGRIISEDVGPQSEVMAEVARTPLSSPLPEVVGQMQQVPTPTAASGNRMAMRYPAGLLAALISGAGLWEYLDEDPSEAIAIDD